ncbi:MAG: hypothetical protein ACFFC7_00700 [Candidatus Hermodarchaeota archaeon]
MEKQVLEFKSKEELEKALTQIIGEEFSEKVIIGLDPDWKDLKLVIYSL